MALCDLTTGFSNPTCFTSNSVGGVTGRVLILTQAVWEETILTQDVNGVITDIVQGIALSGNQGFMFELPRNSPKPTSPSTKGADGGGFTHTIPVLIPKLDQETKNWVASLVNRNLCVAIVENLDGIQNDSTDAAYWELYGVNSLLEASVADSQRANQDTGNGLMLTLSTPTDTTLEYTFPLNVNDGVSRASTTAIIELLTTPL